jgi:hypothetical protein
MHIPAFYEGWWTKAGASVKVNSTSGINAVLAADPQFYCWCLIEETIHWEFVWPTQTSRLLKFN